jgi:hypothetical protein
MIVLEGNVTIVDHQHTRTFTVGDCFVIPMHAKVVWAQAGSIRKFFVATTDGWIRKGPSNGSLLVQNIGDEVIDLSALSVVCGVLFSKIGTQWIAGGLSASCKKFAKGESCQRGLHSVIFIREGVKTRNQVHFSPATAGQPLVFEEDVTVVICTYNANASNPSKL